MKIRTATLAAALGLVVAGCGDNPTCNDQTPPISGVPSCEAVAGTSVTVPLRVCPRCDQSAPRCAVHMENVGSFAIQLEPLSEVCEANSSCPLVDPLSCPFAPVNCTFTAPSAGIYTLVVIDPAGQQIPNKQLTVIAGGTPAACTGYSL